MSGYRTAASDSGDDRFKRRALELLEEGVCAESGDVFVSSWGGAYVVNVVMHRPEMARSWASDVVGLFDADYVCRGGMLLRGTDDKAVYVLVVTDRFIHEQFPNRVAVLRDREEGGFLLVVSHRPLYEHRRDLVAIRSENDKL